MEMGVILTHIRQTQPCKCLRSPANGLPDRTGAMWKLKQVAVLPHKLFGSLKPECLLYCARELEIWSFFR